MPAEKVSVRILGRPIARIFDACDVPLPNICIASNASDELKASWRPAYAARVAHPEDISVLHLPNGTEVSGRAGFATRIGPYLAAEQLTRDDPVDLAATMAMFDAGDPVVDVDHETVLIARFGEGTWGHWLVELLPKLAICEATWPGRFHYAVPHWILQGGTFSDRVLESMAAYGVAPGRLVQVRSDTTMRFSRLHAVTPVVSDMIPHPDVTAVMNRIRQPSPPQPCASKLALLRNDPRRGIANADHVRRALDQLDFTVVDIAERSFADQVALFANARIVFSVLGSSLSGLLFSHDGTHVAAAAPDRFADRFFYGILQTKPGTQWAEIRGPVTAEDPVHYRDSSFEVPIPTLRHTLHLAGA